MRFSSFSKRSGISATTINNIESLSKYFQLPLPCFNFSHRDPLEIYTIVQESLIQHNKKAKKLAEIAKDLVVLCENYNKDLKNLENFKEMTDKKIENLLEKIDEKQEELEAFSLKYQILNNYVEDIEKNYKLILDEREILKQDLNLNKSNARAVQDRLESQLDEQKSIFKEKVQQKERTIERMRVESLTKEKYVEELLLDIERIESEYELEKMKNIKIFEEFKRREDEIFLLRNKLSEAKIECFERFDQDFEIQFKQYEENHLDEGCKEAIFQGVNELLELEKELVSEHDLNLVNLETAEDFDAGQECCRKERRSTIFLLPERSNDRLKIENCESFNIKPVKGTRNFTLNKTCDVSCWPARKLGVHKGKPVARIVRINRLHQKNQKFLFDIRNFSANRRTLKTETWTDSIAQQSSPQHSNPDCSLIDYPPNPFNDRVPEDPIKDYFIKLCQSVKFNSYSNKILQIPTQTLYINLLKSKIPLCNWPETIKLYLYKRLN